MKIAEPEVLPMKEVVKPVVVGRVKSDCCARVCKHLSLSRIVHMKTQGDLLARLVGHEPTFT